MNSKPTLFFPSVLLVFFLMLLVFPSTNSLYAQTISRKKLPFEKICAGGPHPINAGQIFNEYQAQFKIEGFDSSEEFFVELSDPSGSFATPTPTTTLAPLAGTPPDTATDRTLTFAVPTNLVGSNNYELRVKSKSGVVSDSFIINGLDNSTSLPAYFMAYSGSFFINDKNATVSFCNGGSVILTIYNPNPADPTSSPANYPQLHYNWYKNEVLIPGQNSNSLTINTEGVYYAKIDYGPCSDDNYRSQSVTASSASGSGATITSSLGNPFCSGSESTNLTVSAGNSYTWKKDGAVIVGANAQSYLTNIPGTYTCDVDFGGCNATATINLKSTGTVSANGNVVAEGETLHIEQGNILTVTTTATAANPTYKWYRNSSEISGATQSTLDITFAGDYKVAISGCTMSFKVSYSTVIDYNVPKIPNIVTPSNAWIIPDEYTNGKAKVMILSSLGEIVYPLNGDYNYDNSNPWPQSTIEFSNFNPVFYYIITPNGGSAKKGSITLLK